MIKGQGSQIIGAQMINASTGAAFVGSVTAYVDIDGQGQNLGSVGSGVCSSQGNGYFTYGPAAAETAGNLIAFTFIGTGAVPVTVQVATVTPSQQSALSSATGGLSTTVLQIITDAFAEIAVFAPSETIPPGDASFALGKLNRLFDNASADRRMVFTQQFVQYTLTPGLQTPTIGPNSATFTVTTRPTAIRAAQLVLTTSAPSVYLPVDIIDYRQWKDIPVRNITTLPQVLYYEPQWPNGNINLWPIPDAAYGLELITTVTFGQFALTDTLWYPHGYRDWITLKLAKALAPAYPGAIISPMLTSDLAAVESLLFNINTMPPKLDTRDSGMPGGRVGADFNYRSRTFF